MKHCIFAVVIVVLIVSAQPASGGTSQIGSAASGRSLSGNLRLDSVFGQSISGTAGNLTSGFYAQQNLHNFIAGDVDGNGMVTISDAVYLINYIFSSAQAPPNPSSADTDCSGIITISDVVYLLNYIFGGGPGPGYCK